MSLPFHYWICCWRESSQRRHRLLFSQYRLGILGATGSIILYAFICSLFSSLDIYICSYICPLFSIGHGSYFEHTGVWECILNASTAVVLTTAWEYWVLLVLKSYLNRFLYIFIVQRWTWILCWTCWCSVRVYSTTPPPLYSPPPGNTWCCWHSKLTEIDTY